MVISDMRVNLVICFPDEWWQRNGVLPADGCEDTEFGNEHAELVLIAVKFLEIWELLVFILD